MRINTDAMGKVKKQIENLKGSEVHVCINRGRKKYDNIVGIVGSVYPSVFTIECKEGINKTQTFSYFDVLCGNVVFAEKQ